MKEDTKFALLTLLIGLVGTGGSVIAGVFLTPDWAKIIAAVSAVNFMHFIGMGLAMSTDDR